MSDNPYAQPQDFASGPQYLEPKTSILAIFAFVVAILGLVACCIPGVGPLGLLLGVLALVMISMSGGRKKGGGFAIAAIVIGLVAGVINIAVIIGFSMAGKQWAELGVVIEAVEARDLPAVQAKLSPTAAAGLDRAGLDAFADSIHAHAGAMQPRPKGLVDAISLIVKAQADTSLAQVAAQREYSPPSYSLVPIAIDFDSDTLVFMMVVDPTSGGGINGHFTNVGYLAPGGAMVWLVQPPSGHGAPRPPAPSPPPAPVADPADGQDGG